MYLVRCFEEVLGYDSLKAEISKELSIEDRYCDVALKVDGSVKALVEAKAAGLKGLADKHIEQAENYASRAGLRWLVLTNGIEWRLYHLTFNEGEGIIHDLAFEANLLAVVHEQRGRREKEERSRRRNALRCGALFGDDLPGVGCRTLPAGAERNPVQKVASTGGACP
jgi:predicted type IV restriction endonuclease